MGQPRREPRERLRVQALAGSLHGLAGVLAQALGRPLVECHADDRAWQEPAAVETVESRQGHPPREIAGDRGLLLRTPADVAPDFAVLVLAASIGVAVASALLPRLAR